MLAVLSDDPGLLHQSAQTVVGVDALLSVAIDAPDHLIGLVIGVRAGSGDLLVLDVLLQNQVAPLVVGAGSVGLPVVGGSVDLLVQVAVDIIAVIAADARLIGQIAQTVIGVGAGGVAVVVMGVDEPVQRVIGVKGLVLGLADAVAPHILIGHVAVGIIRISMLLGLSGLLAGMGVVHRQKATHLVIGIILHPAVGITYATLSEALEAKAIDPSILPTWYPSGYQCTEVYCRILLDSTKIRAQYSNGESEYSITIHRFTTALKASQSFLEKDDGEFDVRNINGVDYYMLSNVNNRKVTWIVDNLQVVISGSLSDDEINSMIDSINEG